MLNLRATCKLYELVSMTATVCSRFAIEADASSSTRVFLSAFCPCDVAIGRPHALFSAIPYQFGHPPQVGHHPE